MFLYTYPFQVVSHDILHLIEIILSLSLSLYAKPAPYPGFQNKGKHAIPPSFCYSGYAGAWETPLTTSNTFLLWSCQPLPSWYGDCLVLFRAFTLSICSFSLHYTFSWCVVPPPPPPVGNFILSWLTRFLLIVTVMLYLSFLSLSYYDFHFAIICLDLWVPCIFSTGALIQDVSKVFSLFHISKEPLCHYYQAQSKTKAVLEKNTFLLDDFFSTLLNLMTCRGIVCHMTRSKPLCPF